MKNLVRILGIILLLSSTALFIAKLFVIIAISHFHLAMIFLVGAVCNIWANWGNSEKEERKRIF